MEFLDHPGQASLGLDVGQVRLGEHARGDEVEGVTLAHFLEVAGLGRHLGMEVLGASREGVVVSSSMAVGPPDPSSRCGGTMHAAVEAFSQPFEAVGVAHRHHLQVAREAFQVHRLLTALLQSKTTARSPMPRMGRPMACKTRLTAGCVLV